MIDCPSYELCSAPLCPLNEDSLREAVWYPDEDVCRKWHIGRQCRWVRVQRKIARLPDPERRGYFTHAMLDAVGKVSKGINGIDVDKRGDKDEQEATWIAKRSRSLVTPEQRQRLRDFAEKRRKAAVTVAPGNFKPCCAPEGIQEGGAQKAPISAPFLASDEDSAAVGVSGPETPLGKEKA